MSNQAFDIELHIGSDRAPAEITDLFAGEHYFHASLLQNGGITPDTFVEFAGRFAVLCDESYGGSRLKLTVDTAHPKMTIDCEALREELAENPGDQLATPVNVDIFKVLFKTANTVDLVVRPIEDIPEMPSTFSKVSWERSAGNLIDFYAQGGSGSAGTQFTQELYERMFNVSESVPRKGIDVALGIIAAKELRRYAIGSEEFTRQLRANFDFISRYLGRPDSSFYLDCPEPNATSRLAKFFNSISRRFAK